MARRPLTDLGKSPSLPARYADRRAMFHRRRRIESRSLSAPQPYPRARSKEQSATVGETLDTREKMVTRACEPTGASKSHGRADKLIDLVSSSSIDDT